MHWKGGDEPAANIRPSQAQFTAIRELLSCRVFYVDLGLLHPHDIRTSRSNRWTDWIDQKGVPHRAEVHGPATPVNWRDNWAVFECAIIMANAARPPRIEAYGSMFLKHVEHYPESLHWAISATIVTGTKMWVSSSARKRTSTTAESNSDGSPAPLRKPASLILTAHGTTSSGSWSTGRMRRAGGKRTSPKRRWRSELA